MCYREYQAPPELAPWIKMFWVFEHPTNQPLPETIVTDGFPELIIHFGSPFTESDQQGQFSRQSSALACGQLTRPLILQSSENVGMIGIRFHPSGMAPFIPFPVQVLANLRLPIRELFNDSDQLIEEVVNSESDSQRIAACCRFLERSIDLDRERPYVRATLRAINECGGQVTVDALASEVGKSRRSLEEAFQKEVGTSPKTYCRIVRFRSVFDALTTQGPAADWVQIALDSGFFDQAHLIRDFRQFAGTSPTAFLQEQAAFAQAVNQA